jgi:hypothetical protein
MYRKSVTTSASNNPSKPTLSLILCSRNDQYMGNSRWRLQTTLNYVAQMAHEISREEDVEVLVADWGSEIPLREILELSPLAARMVSFILIPPEIARDLQKDSPFAEVLALNAAARRSSGEYIGRIDQDTLVGKRFFEYFFELYEGKQQLEAPLDSALLFANQRMFPYRVVICSPSLWTLEKFIGWFGRFLKIEVSPKGRFYCHGVGIWLIHRNLWNECGGYDERLIYMNAMEINMIARLMKKYKIVNLGQLVNYVFYHLEHYHPWVRRSSSTHRKINPEAIFAKNDILNPNGSDWGLDQYHFEKLPYSPNGNKAERVTFSPPTFRWLSFTLLLVSTGAQMAWDKLIVPAIVTARSFRRLYDVWKRHAQRAWETVHHQPLIRWPRLLVNLWVQRKRRI